MRTTSVLVAAFLFRSLATGQITTIFNEDFEGGTAASLAANGWTWTGNEPVFITGDNSSFGAGKESSDLSVPPLPAPSSVPFLFHPVPYDPAVLYRIVGSMMVENPLGGVAIANINIGWYHPTDGFLLNGINSGSSMWETHADLPYLQMNNPGIPGAQFGVALSINPSATGAHAYFDNITITTQPNLAMFMGRVLLDGPYNANTGLMRTTLTGLSTFPLTEPFTALGYPQLAGGGGESTNAQVLASGQVVDWVRLEVRSIDDPTVLVATRQALITSNGAVFDVNGEGHPFFGVPPDDYYVAVRHRNHLGAMSAAPIHVPNAAAGGIFNDFGSANYPVWGTGPRKAIGSARTLWAGDVTGDHRVKYVGSGNDRDPILVAIGGTVLTATLNGQYRREDLNMDGVVKYSGDDNDRDIILLTIGGVVPTSVRAEQVP